MVAREKYNAPPSRRRTTLTQDGLPSSPSGIGAAAADRYFCTYVPAAAGAPATGKVKVRDADAATAMSEVAGAADLSTVTFTFEVTGA